MELPEFEDFVSLAIDFNQGKSPFESETMKVRKRV